LRTYEKSKSDHRNRGFAYCGKLIKTTIKRDRSHWLKFVDENLKTKPNNFWKYVSQFKKIDHNFHPTQNY
jgi:hypothetical protein